MDRLRARTAFEAGPDTGVVMGVVEAVARDHAGCPVGQIAAALRRELHHRGLPDWREGCPTVTDLAHEISRLPLR